MSVDRHQDRPSTVEIADPTASTEYGADGCVVTVDTEYGSVSVVAHVDSDAPDAVIRAAMHELNRTVNAVGGE